MAQQIETQASFSLPIAYIRVPAGYTQGQAIDPSNVIDIRPFFRTAELTYNERAAIAASVSPNGRNPFITRTALDATVSSIVNSSNENGNSLQILEGELDVAQTDISEIKNDLYGVGSSETTSSKNFEGRILNLEGGSTGGTGGSGHKMHLFPFPIAIAGGSTQIFGTFSSPKLHAVGQFIQPSHHNKVVAGLFRVREEPQPNITGALDLRIGATSMDTLIANAISIPNMPIQPMNYHSFPCSLNETGSGSSYSATFRTATQGSDGHRFTLWLDGYIYEG